MKKISIVVALAIVISMVTAAANFLDLSEKSQNFNAQIQYNTPGGENEYPWWAIADHNGQNYGSACDPSGTVCITRMQENGLHFARLSRTYDPDNVVRYDNADFAELRTGYSTNQGVWLPTLGHSVVFSQMTRFGPTYAQDGSGGAVGSAGGGLWNSYPNALGPSAPITAFWWTWGQTGQFGGAGQGLQVNAWVNNYPVFLPVHVPLNMQDWMTWKFTWTDVGGGYQTINFTVSQYDVSHDLGTVTVPAIQSLSEESWNDNQMVNAFFQQVFNNIPVGQIDYWDMTNMDISQQ